MIVLLLIVYVLVTRGYSVVKAELSDGGVWVTRDTPGSFARVNDPVHLLDGGIIPARASTDVDVLQDGSTVLARDMGRAQLQAIDVQGMSFEDRAVPIPSDDAVEVGGGTLARLGSTGRLWAVRFDPNDGAVDVGGIAPSARPLATVGPGALAVGTTGAVFTVSNGGELTTIEPRDGGFAPPRTQALGIHTSGEPTISAVGQEPVVLEHASGTDTWTVLLPGGQRVALPAHEARLQQPGPSADAVLVEADDKLVSVPLTGGAVSVLSKVAGGGTPIPPVTAGGCDFGAWYGDHGAVATSCDGSPASVVPLRTTDASLVFRQNLGEVVLNDRATGALWSIVHGSVDPMTQPWRSLQPMTKTGAHSHDQHAPSSQTKSLPPKAVPDHLGARPGRTTVLHVLDNDSDPSGRILTVSSVTQPTGAGTRVTVAPDEQTLDLTLPQHPSGVTTFHYQVTNGVKASASALVTVQTRLPDEETPPALRAGYQPHLWHVPSGGTLAIPVTPDWRDPDGDTVSLERATVTSGSVVVDPAGELRYSAPADSGRASLSYLVTDGMGRTVTGHVEVVVEGIGARAQPAVAEPDVASGPIGRPIVVSPLDNDLPGSDPLQPDASLSLAGPVSQPAYLDVATDMDTGTVTVTGHRLGTYELGYTVADGSAPSARGVIRVSITPTSSAGPIAVPDAAVLVGDQTATVDVLVNDDDPQGNLLDVVGVSSPPDVDGLQATVVDGRWVRISASGPLTPRTQQIHYEVTDGVTPPVTGQITVTQVPISQSSLAPVAVPDEALVRSGDSTTVPVLENDFSPKGLPLDLVQYSAGLPHAGVLAVSPRIGAAYTDGNDVRYVAPRRVAKQQVVTVTYYVEDASGTQTRGQLTVTVTPPPSRAHPDQPPTPQDVEGRVVTGGTIRFAIPTSGVDPDGDSVSVTGLGSVPSLGRIIAISPASINYQAYPDLESTGTDAFRYVVTDSYGQSSEATIRVAVIPPRRPQRATAQDITLTAAPGAQVRVDVLAQALSDPGDSLSIDPGSLSSTPAGQARLDGGVHGDVLVTANTSLRAAPLQVDYAIVDALGVTTRATITVHSVPGANIPPVALDHVANPKSGERTVRVNALAGDFDPDGDKVWLIGQGSSTSPYLRIAVKRTPQVIPYVIRDAQGALSSGLIRVPAVGGGAPRSSGKTLTIGEGASKTIHIAPYVVDPAGKPVRLTTGDQIWASPTFGLSARLQPGSATDLVVTGHKGYDGPGSVSFQVTDGRSLTDRRGHFGIITVPVQVGPPRPVLSCPNTEIPYAEGTSSVLRLAYICHVWTPPSIDPSRLRYRVSIATNPDPGRLDVVGSGSSEPKLQVADAAKPGHGTLDVSIVGSEAKVQLPFQVVPAPPPTVIPVRTAVQARRQVVIDVTNVMSSPFRHFDAHVLGSVDQLSGDRARVSIAGSRITIAPNPDAHGTMVFSYLASDVPQRSYTPRQVRGTISVDVLGHPGTPGTPVPDRTVASHQVNLSWATPPSNGLPITRYEVAYQANRTTTCPASPCAIKNLQNGVAYRFSVTAVNAEGSSHPSGLSVPVTPNAVPDRPTGLAIVRPGDERLTLTWNAAHVDGTPVTHYIVEWGTHTLSVPGNARSALIAYGLGSNDQIHSFSLVAVNSQGPSQAATAAGYSDGTPSAPAPPTFQSTNEAGGTRAVRVSWHATSPNGEGPTTYTLTRSWAGGMSKVVCAATVQRSCDDDGIQNNGTVYTYTVTASNAAGFTSPPSGGTTMEASATPDPIRHYQARGNDQNGEILLAFDAPASHGPVSQIQCTIGSSSCGTWSMPVDGKSDVHRLLTQMPNGVQQSITLVDCNGSQGGQQAGHECDDPVTATATPYGPIGQPTITANPVGNKQVTWSVSVDPNGKPVHVHVTSASGTYDWDTQNTPFTSPVETDTPGYGADDSITVTVTDPGRQTQTAQRSVEAWPEPYITVAEGGPYHTPYCGGPYCHAIIVNMYYFSPGDHTLWFDTDCGPPGSAHDRCVQQGGTLHYVDETVSAGADGHAYTDDRAFGYPDAKVWVDCEGVQSNQIVWQG
jgi:hypothetical protein